jgi:hypothetical protein
MVGLRQESMPICSKAPPESLTRAVTVQPSRWPSGRAAREASDVIGVLPDPQNDGFVVSCLGEWDGIVGVGAEPGRAAVEASADVGVVVIQD